MGLDTVAIVMEMEETFQIKIDDLDAGKIGTVGQAYRTILGKLELRQPLVCPSASLFYKLRRALMTRSGADRGSLRPSSRIADFLPERGRREAWIGLQDEIGMSMPRLEFGVGLKLAAAFLAFGPISAASAALFWSLRGISWEVLLVAISLGSLALFATYPLLKPFANKIPQSCETIRRTIETTLGHDRLIHQDQATPWTREEVWFTLRALVAVQVGVSLDEVTEEKSFVDDFGMD